MADYFNFLNLLVNALLNLNSKDSKDYEDNSPCSVTMKELNLFKQTLFYNFVYIY